MMHFTQSPEPIPFHTPGPIQTLCRKMLFDIELSFAFDGEICGRKLQDLLAEQSEQYEMNSLRICPKCLRAEFTERYLSGIRPRVEEVS